MLLTNESRPWRPAPIISLSILLHGAAIVAFAAQPSLWRWVVGAVLVNHLLLSAAVLWPKGSLLGSNVIRLPTSAIRRSEISLTFDDGPDPLVTPKVLDLLDRYQAKASFFCIAEKAAAFPEIVREITRRGHSVENHSFRHPYTFAFYGFSRLHREVESAQTIIAGITGQSPQFFRAPAGFRSPMLDPVLAKHGLQYVSWTRRALDGVRGDASLALRRLSRGLTAGDVLLLHDGTCVRTKEGEAVVLAVLPALLDQIAAQGLRAVPLPTAFKNSSNEFRA
jgi:peptidoglycan/xylan/chitin deacetylase (PgdA/CDA1 family)